MSDKTPIDVSMARIQRYVRSHLFTYCSLFIKNDGIWVKMAEQVQSVLFDYTAILVFNSLLCKKHLWYLVFFHWLYFSALTTKWFCSTSDNLNLNIILLDSWSEKG